MHDFTIIGAGPAGCVAALVLARAKRRAILVEQHHFPRDKVCGECLSALGFESIHRLGLKDSFSKLAPVELTRTAIHPCVGQSFDIPLPQPMWGISRKRFDQWLLDCACEAGAELRSPARCEHIDSAVSESVSVVVRDLSTNVVRSFESQWVLLADGKRSFAQPKPVPTDDLGVKAHFANIAGPRDAIELFGVDGHYGGIAPIEDDRWNLAFSVPRRRVMDHHGDFDAMFEQIAGENPVLRGRLRHAVRCSPWLASPLPRFAISRSWQARVIPLGNAASSIEPVGGEGMGLAMRSAELAATMMLSNRFDPRSLRQQFRRLWLTRGVSCRAMAKLVSSPKLGMIISAAGKLSPVCRSMMSLMGKNDLAPVPKPDPSRSTAPG